MEKMGYTGNHGVAALHKHNKQCHGSLACVKVYNATILDSVRHHFPSSDGVILIGFMFLVASTMLVHTLDAVDGK